MDAGMLEFPDGAAGKEEVGCPADGGVSEV